jgi:hypothetical protein
LFELLAIYLLVLLRNMEIRREDEVEDMSLSPPTIGSMQIAGSTGFGHNIEYMSQAYLRSRYSEIDIEDDSSNTNKDHPLPIYLKVLVCLTVPSP